ncbi:Os11g0241000 [Oryza sativa Japonica Group]|uniref:Os11g0241000 protein n=1 Tax=Oryza sativa subsp. japonica TaxID=39947 RepID=A0A0P0Y133_ORYSJ|nr:Os11g0241000 [Oryza sativa Japonica Group]
MKKPSTLLRSLSTRLSTRLAPSPAVAPWPPVRSAYDRWLAAELDELRAGAGAPLAAPCCAGAAWLARALALASAAQRRLVSSASAGAGAGAGVGIDRKSVDECVEDAAELLDACAGLRDRLEMIRGYVSSMRVALHWLGDGAAAVTARRRAAAAFAECEAVERRCGAELAKELIGVRMVLLEWSQAARGHQLLKF